MASIFEQAETFKRDLLARDRAAAARLTDAYAKAWKQIKRQLDTLTAQIQQSKLRGEEINQAWLFRQDRYLALLRQVGEQIGKFAEIAGKEITREQRKAVQAAEADAQRLLLVGAETAGVEANFNQLPRSAVENIVGFLGNGSPLRILLDELPRNSGTRIAKILTTGVAAGRSPREMAREIRDQADIGLTRALTIARTETLRAYREATYQVYRGNGDLVNGWYWVTALQSRSCAACIALHGTFHPITERQAAHVNCRCTQVPALRGAPSPVPQTGEQWFTQQPAATKREILDSDAAYEAVRDGRARLRDFVGRKDSIEWGPSYVALPVGQAINGEGRFPANERPRDLTGLIVPREVPGPRGTPVSRALNVVKDEEITEPVTRAISIIDSLHGDGELPRIPVTMSMARDSNGTYMPYGVDAQTPKIRISRYGQMKDLTAVHEIGHFLDHKGIGKQGNFGEGEALKPFYRVANRSRAIRSLLKQLKQEYYDIDGLKYEVDHKFIRYLLINEEIWARAYAQWVAIRSADSVMLDQLRKVREDWYPANAAAHWADDDFEPIASAIDDLMEKLGWRKS